MFLTRRSWTSTLAAMLLLTAPLAGCGEDEENASGGAARPSVTTATETVTTATETVTTATATTPAQTIQDARQSVDDDAYSEALTIAAALTAAEANSIRRRISNQIARRVRAAVRAGNRAGAGRLLRNSGGLPKTQALVQVRASYKAAKAQAAQRAQARREAAAQRRRAADQAEQMPTPSPPSSQAVPSGTCSETSQTDFSVPPGDPRDRDGDGIACES